MRTASQALIAGVLTLAVVARGVAQETADAKALAAKGVAFLKTAQAADGSFSADAGPGVTAIVTAALLASGAKADDPAVAKALAWLQKFVHDDGGIYPQGSTHQNYETCVAIMAFHAANADGRYRDLVKKAEEFIRKEQWDDGENLTPADLAYGGAGYGGSSRPDLSNTAFLLDSLTLLGATNDDPAIQRALVFVSRCQNLETKHNDTDFAAKNPDGGFYYTIAKGGGSPAGTTENGGLRSYGSMTYAGLRSMIFAGVDQGDERVVAARGWIAKNYTLEENPGMGPSGLYYYYHTFAKTMDATGDAELKDDGGTVHDWKHELVAALAARQQPNGRWVNQDQRWLEGDANLATAYSLLALSYCQ
jgi:squalene-hopene/tetraprenyl-beta-curcumene cyclase